MRQAVDQVYADPAADAGPLREVRTNDRAALKAFRHRRNVFSQMVNDRPISQAV